MMKLIAANDNTTCVAPPPQRKSHGNVAIIIIAALLALAMSSTPAAAATCQPTATAKVKTWRMIDGKRCYSSRKIPRQRLRWPARPSMASPPDDPLMISYWPPITFADRWRDILRQLTGG